ncbi:MAG: hypothetical protein AB8B84_11970 [Granulosicoccus sp.]
MKSYKGETAEMEEIQQQKVDAKKRERANGLKKATCVCKDFGLNAEMLNGSLARGRCDK